MDSNQINYITLIKYKEAWIIIQNSPLLLIIGITDTGKIFMRVCVNNIYCYENLLSFIDLSAENAFYFVFFKIINNDYSIQFMDESKILFILFQSDDNPNVYIKTALIFKNNLNKFKITNEDIMKSLFNFNMKYNVAINDSQIIDLSSRSIQDNAFIDLSNIKLNIIILNLSYNKIKDISALNSDSFKNLQKLYLTNNEIEDLKCINNLRLDYLLELKLDSNKIVDITPLQNAIFKQIQILNLSRNKISNIGALQNIEFDNLTKLNLSKLN
jgi:Leucine-rich repeat (LRR) protein